MQTGKVFDSLTAARALDDGNDAERAHRRETIGEGVVKQGRGPRGTDCNYSEQEGPGVGNG